MKNFFDNVSNYIKKAKIQITSTLYGFRFETDTQKLGHKVAVDIISNYI